VQARAGYLELVRRGGVHYDHHLADFYCEAMVDGAKAVHWARRDIALRENFSTPAAPARAPRMRICSRRPPPCLQRPATTRRQRTVSVRPAGSTPA
jgi:hypothetical protein